MYRVSIVCEGPTDRIIIEAILNRFLNDYISVPVQPPRSLYSNNQGPFGGGWKGVREWCIKEVRELGGLNQVGMKNSDLLIIHIDADVADEDEIQCARACPPPEDTVEELHRMLLTWLGEDRKPEEVLFCVPSKSIEAWVLAALFPNDRHVFPCTPTPNAAKGPCLECRPDIASILIGKRPKLVKRQNGRHKKITSKYIENKAHFQDAWTNVRKVCSLAEHFHQELKNFIM